MAASPEGAVHAYFQRSRAALDQAAADRDLVAAVVAISGRLTGVLRAGGKILLAGNGGSAADAQHIAAEFLSRFVRNRAPLPAIALTTDTSALTAISNDFGFEHVFERQVRALGRKGDAFIGISTSGESQSVLAALDAARELGMITIGFTGARGQMAPRCDLLLTVASRETSIVQQIHITAAHAICEAVEDALFGPAPGG
jgi:D-sedoheptulose 7-phosphate isomerase